MTASENLVERLNSQLEQLSDVIQPLLTKSIGDTLSSLENLDQAKLQVLLSYLIHDVSWIYLKTRGIDPNSHPVVAELERVKSYFAKVAKHGAGPSTSDARVDKDAAERFIRHAIATGANDPAPQPRPRPKPRESDLSPDVGTHTRFKFLSKQQEAPMTVDSDEEDTEMQVYVESETPVVDQADAKPADTSLTERKKSRKRPLPTSEAEATLVTSSDPPAGDSVEDVERKRLKAERKRARQAKRVAKEDRKKARAAAAL